MQHSHNLLLSRSGERTANTLILIGLGGAVKGKMVPQYFFLSHSVNCLRHVKGREGQIIFGEKQSLTHHFYKVGISFKIVLQSMDDQVIFALCLA